jgi:hypothetical protein
VFIVRLGSNEERHFEVFLVIVERSLVQVTFIDAERNERVHDFLYKTLIDGLAISLALDKAQDRASEFCLLSLDM